MIIWLFTVLVGLFLVLGVYLYFNQGRMIFMPMKELAITFSETGLEGEDIYIQVVPEEKINAWYFTGKPGEKTILFCHGNAGNISHRLETVQFLKDLEVNILLFDYRGYGLSDGHPTEEGAYADTRAAFNWLVSEKKIEPSDIIIFGRSLGGAVAIELASKISCGGIIVESSFTSVSELGAKMFPLFPVKYLLRYDFDSIGRIKHLKCPILVTHSPEDEMIPYEMGQRLYENAPEPKYFIDLHGSHNDREYLGDKTYIEAMTNFIFNSKSNSRR